MPARVLALFDEAIAWLVERGQTGQWGSTPFSQIDARVAAAAEWAACGGLRIAEAGDGSGRRDRDRRAAGARLPAAGARALHRGAGHVPRARGAGHRRRARAPRDQGDAHRGLRLLRVDCWAGAPALVAWYERQGFRRSGTFTVRDWHGQVFSMELP